MTAGKSQMLPIQKDVLWEDYYENLHSAYNALRVTFVSSGLTQDQMATMLDVDKSLISKRMKGSENPTLKTLSFMATAMGCRLDLGFRPYTMVGTGNRFSLTPIHHNTTTSSTTNQYSSGVTVTSTNPSKELETV